MATNIRHKRSAVAGKQPIVSQLQSGELAINTADGKVYLLRDDNTVQDITKRIFEGDSEVKVDDLGNDNQAQVTVTVNNTERMIINDTDINLKDRVNIEDANTLTFKELTASGDDGVGLKAPDTLVDGYTLTLPPVTGTIGQLLKTDGSGNLSFTDPDIFGGNVIYVSEEQGDDDNDGQSAPVRTIKRACKLASAIVYNADGTLSGIRVNIKVAVGDYTEDNPVIIPDNVVVKGDGLRGCIVRPANANLDMFRVRNACYFGEFTFRDGVDANGIPTITWDYATVFDDPNATDVTDRSEYTNLPDTKPRIFTSPYTQNASIISFLGGSGAKIDGALVESPNVPDFAIEAENPAIGAVPEQGKSMVANAYTMLSFGGTGWRLLNDAYAQIVSCFQIFLLNGVYTQSGGYCSITNSATNFGLYALRSSGYSPKAFEFDRATVTATGQSDGKQTLTIVGVNRDAPVEEFVLRFRDAGYRTAYETILAEKNSIADDTVTWIQAQIAAATPSIWAGFDYNVEKCKRDVNLLLDAIRQDAVFNSNYRSVSAGLRYYNGTFDTLPDQRDQHVAAFTYAKSITDDYLGDSTFIARVNALWDEIIDIVENGEANADAYSFPTPTGGSNNASDAGYANAVQQLIANKAFVQDEVTSWIADQVSAGTDPFSTDFSYNSAKCQEDIGLIIDALVYDLTYGGNLQTYDAALAYFVGTVAQYGSGKKEETIAAYGRLKTVIGQVIQETAVTTSSGTTETQDTSGTAGSAAAATKAESLVQEIIDYLDADGDASVSELEQDYPDISWTTQSLQDNYNILDYTTRINIAQNVNEYIEEQISAAIWYNFTYDIEKCRRDTRLIVEAVAKDTWDTGNRYTRSAGLSYYTNNLADSSRSQISGQERQTIAAIERASVLTNTVISGLAGVTLDIEDFVDSRFEVVKEAIRDPLDIPDYAEVSSEGDVTNSFKPAPTEQTFDASTDVNKITNIFTITGHGYTNGQKVIYDPDGSTPIGGLDPEQTYYIKLIDENEFSLTFDDSLEFNVDLFDGFTNSGTHKFLSNIIEFFVEEITSSHTTYQELILESGAENYEFVPGRQIAGATGANNNAAIVHSWVPVERKLIVSIEQVTVGSSTLRIQFDATSTITSDHAGSPNTSIGINEVRAIRDLGTATFTITATDGTSSLTNLSNLPEKACWFHRPSIVNSSSHTWEFAGSGTDYNALPQNGGNTREEYEQFEELPGRCYSSGTNELGDFKVGDFITAFNRTGNITFRNKVQVDELDALRLSLSDVAIEEISTSVNLGDDEIGGPSDARLSTQAAVRNFISNRLGGFVDKTVSTAAVPGAIVQLNTNGQLNADLIPATRQFTNTNSNGYLSRLELVNDIPASDLKAGDIATENYQQVELTLSGGITAEDGDEITQPGVEGAVAYAKGDYTNSTNILVATQGERWDETNDSTADPWEVSSGTIYKNGVDTGLTVDSKGTSSDIVDNFFLRSSISSQYLVLDPDDDYTFTSATITNIARSSNVSTITTSGAHNFQIDNNVQVVVEGDTTFSVNGKVLSVPSATTFTISNTGDDVSSTGDSGTARSIVTSADGNAQGAVSEVRYGVLTNVDNGEITGGSLYTPTSATKTYEDVALTNVSGTGTGATADITITAGQVTDVDIKRGGTGYSVGDVVSCLASSIGGTGSGFEVEVTSIEKRAYVNILGGELFVASATSIDFVEDNSAVQNAFIVNLDDTESQNFLAGTTGGGGAVDYTTYRITMANHLYGNGDPVIYNTLGNVAIGGLINGQVYYTKRIDNSTVELYEDFSLLNQVEFTSTPANNNHNITRRVVNQVDNSLTVLGHGLTTGDAVRIETLSDGSSANELFSVGGEAISSGSRFFVGSVTTNSFTIHELRSDALASINGLVTNAKDIDGQGIGSAEIIPNNVQVTTVINTSSRIKDNWNTLAVTNIDAGNIISGTISPSRLASSGVANTDTFLRGDSSYQTVVQSIKKANTTDNPITLTGSSLANEFYGDPVNIGISNVDYDPLGTFSTLGVARFIQSQFDVNDNGSGEVFVKDGVIDAGTLDSLDSAYFLNPANLTSLVPVNRGGTNISTYAVGDILYAQSAGSLNTLEIGRQNSFLKSNGTTPEWGTALDLAEGLDVGSANLTSSSTGLGQVYNENVITLELGSDAENVKIGASSTGRDISSNVVSYEASTSQDVTVNLNSITKQTNQASANTENVILFGDTAGILFGMLVTGSGNIPANTTVTGVTDAGEVFLSNDLTGSILTSTNITFTTTPLTLGIRAGDTVTINGSGITNVDGTWPVLGASETATSFTIRVDANVSADPAIVQNGTIIRDNTLLLRNRNVILGSAEASASPIDAVIKGESGIGNNIAGGDLTLAGGLSTGSATGGSVVIQTGDTGTAGDIEQSYVTRMTVNTDGDVIIPGYLTLTGTGALKVPVGTSAQRPSTLAQGQVRYNTDDSTFEGYDGSNWGSLGGVKDVDQDTFINAETSAGADNDQLDFHTAGTQRMQIGDTGDLGFGDGLNKFNVAFTTGDTDIAGDVTITGDLTVNGTTTTINTSELSVDDKNIELGAVATPTDTTADGGGITLKGATDKTINWINATDSWTSSENFELASSKVYRINGASVLSSTTLGGAVVNSSLTSVGTIGTGTWQGTIISPTYGGTGVNNGTKTITLGGNFTHSGAHTLSLTTTGNTALTLPTSGTVANRGNLSQFAATTSAQLAGVISDETGSGALVFGTSPTITTGINAASTTMALFNTTATTVNFAGAATNIQIGAASGTTNINNNLDVDGDINIDGGDLTFSDATINIANTTSTTVNFAGAGTGVTIGATTGTTTIRNATTTLNGNLNVNGTTIDTDETGTFNLLKDNATTIAFGQAATSIVIGETTGTTRFRHSVDIDGDANVDGTLTIPSLNNTPIGNITPSSGAFTTLAANSFVTFTDATNADRNETFADDAPSVKVTGGIRVAKDVVADNFWGDIAASQITSGTFANARVSSGNVTQHQGDITGTGVLNSGSINTGFGNINIGTSIFTGSGAGLTNVNASSITSVNNSVIPDAAIAASSITQHQGSITGTGALNSGSITDGFGSINIGTSTFTGNGSGLSSLNASRLSSGTVAGARLGGNQSMGGVKTFTNTSAASSTTTGAVRVNGGLGVQGAIYGGSFNGTGSGLTQLNASNLSSGTVPNARIDGTYGNLTGTGVLNAGEITTGFGNINIGTNTFTGNGSGLTNVDADLLDGINSTQFVRSDQADTMTGRLTMSHAGDEMIRMADTSASGNPYISWYQAGTRRAYMQFVDSGNRVRIYNDVHDDFIDLLGGVNGLKHNADGTEYTVWTSGNDGAGSGLDADLLDGESSAFYRNASNINAGTFPDRFSATTRYNIGLIDGNSSQTRDKLRVWDSGTYSIGMKSGYTYGGLNDYAMSFQMSDTNNRGFWWGDTSHNDAQGAMSLTTNGRLTVASSARIGFGETDTTSPGSNYTLEVNGTFAATSKSFVIDHPTKDGMKLRHGTLEGPEDGVYVRGRLKDTNVIELPDYWTGLVHEDTITVNLTAVGGKQDIWVEDIVDNTVIVGSDEPINCFYTVYGERKDVDRWDTEYEE